MQPNVTTTKVQVSCCGGRRDMTLAQRTEHFRYCRHPECVARMAQYEQIAQFCKEHRDDDKKPKS